MGTFALISHQDTAYAKRQGLCLEKHFRSEELAKDKIEIDLLVKVSKQRKKKISIQPKSITTLYNVSFWAKMGFSPSP